MRRLSIARSVAAALLGLAILLALLAGIGVSALYATRQRYEDRLEQTYGLQTAAGRLLAASVVEEATVRTASGPRARVERRAARQAFGDAVASATQQAAGDAPDLALVGRIAADQARLRRRFARGAGGLAARDDVDLLSTRQDARRLAARARARSDTRRDIIAIAIAGGLALVVALALVLTLISRVRTPLQELLDAAGRIAAGDLEARVREAGPAELRTLARAFNAMAQALADALTRLEEGRRRLALTIESLGDALIVVDPGGRVLAANPRAAVLLAQAREGEALPEGLLPSLERALGTEVALEHEGRTLSATAAMVEEGEEAGSAVWTVRDTSERARLERLKSEFVATASHELRSPLTSIKGFAELLGTDPALSARQREFVDIVVQSSNRLVALVDDLLDVARIEAGQVEVVERPVDLEEIVREVTALMGQRLQAKGQVLRLEVPDDMPRAHADPGRMRQVLTNLLTNAHLYTPEGGTLQIVLAADDQSTSLTVADDGPGMGVEQLERVFDRFYRALPARAERGSGLGLAIVRSLVDLQHGTIDVRSRPGEGTAFTVRLPRARPGAGWHGAAALGGRSVLVVDDEPDIAALIVARLQELGARAEPVTDGRRALERLREQHFDAVTLDILMAGMSGFDVLRELRADAELSHLPVVVVSVFSKREALAGEWVVSKPIDPEVLAEMLGTALRARRARVLVVAREELYARVRPVIDGLRIGHRRAADRDAVRELCAAERFEAALVDFGIDDLHGVLEAIDLRGRRPGRAVFVLDGEQGAVPEPAPEGTAVTLEELSPALLAALGVSGGALGIPE